MIFPFHISLSSYEFNTKVIIVNAKDKVTLCGFFPRLERNELYFENPSCFKIHTETKHASFKVKTIAEATATSLQLSRDFSC